MQPWFESVSIPPNRSCYVFDRRLPEFTFNWHYHPEYELTFTVNSRGTRFVGDHVAFYDDGDLVLLGPDVPHAWQSETPIVPREPHRAIVCWFTKEWIEDLKSLIPEFASLEPLLAEAQKGVSFGKTTTDNLRGRLLALCALPESMQVIELQSILLALSATQDRQTLAAGEVSLNEAQRDRLRIERVLTWIHRNFHHPIRLAPLCDIVHISESQLQRVFKRSTHMSISQYVTRLRIGRACQQLVRTDRSMDDIAAACGFSDSAHFSRKFKDIMRQPPTHYRARFQRSGPVIPDGVFDMKPRSHPPRRPTTRARPAKR